MKPILLLSVLSLSLLFMGCSSVGSSVSGENDRPEDSISDDKDYYRNLADFLHRVPGVNISGSGDYVTVTIRGINSFNSGITPLYVIDGNAVGNSYSQANNMVNARDIDYVRVLKGSDAASYGVRGGNGVILIVTKKI